MNIRLLTIGSEYNGDMKLYGCGIHSANLFEDEIKLKLGDRISKIKSLRGKEECTSKNIVINIKDIISNLYDEKVIIYYSGHGDIKKGEIEYWNTSEGCLDQIMLADILNQIEDNSSVILFSDSCDSSHNINQIIMKKSYISIGATQQYEDAIMTSDGGVMTYYIIETLRIIDVNCTVKEFWDTLMSYNVDVEHFSLKCSNIDMINNTMF